MKNNDFKELLNSIDHVRKIHKGRLKPGRVFKFNPVAVKRISARETSRVSIQICVHDRG